MILPGTGRGTAPEGRGGGGRSLRKPEVYAARRLRREMSPPEVLLWSQLRGSKLGFKVRRQHPIGAYVADFFVREAGLVIEIDGEAHDRGDRPARDACRDQYLAGLGYRTLRIMAADVMKDLDSVMRFISERVTTIVLSSPGAERVAGPLHRPSDGPPPRSGEEF